MEHCSLRPRTARTSARAIVARHKIKGNFEPADEAHYSSQTNRKGVDCCPDRIATHPAFLAFAGTDYILFTTLLGVVLIHLRLSPKLADVAVLVAGTSVLSLLAPTMVGFPVSPIRLPLPAGTREFVYTARADYLGQKGMNES